MSLHTPLVMGILNVTPDSFYDGGRFLQKNELLRQVEKMMEEGAAIIDIGGYSSRPGAAHISAEEELNRVIPAIRLIRSHFQDVTLSVDTCRSSVARRAVEAGAHFINDISGGEADAGMISTVSDLQVPYICMHMKGDPQTMNSLAVYDNLIHDVVSYFHQKLHALRVAGVKDVIIDPGFGFAKTVEHNFKLLQSLEHLRIFGKPLLVGLSRKSMIWKTLKTTPDLALNGTTALHTIALMKGASILRVHDVREATEIIKLFQALNLR